MRRFLYLSIHIGSSSLLERFIIVACVAYTIRLFVHYFQLAFASYVFLTKNELKQLGLLAPGSSFSRFPSDRRSPWPFEETGFVVCDDPQVAETTYNRHKYFHRFLCWISPQALQTTILNKHQNPSATIPLRVLTATLADRVSSLVNPRHLSSPTKVDQQVRR